MPTIRVYDGRSYEPMGVIDDASGCEVAFSLVPDAASVTMPSTSANLAASRIMPHGEGAIYEVDATDLGVPVWVGRIRSGPQWSPTSGDCTVQLSGAREDLASEPVQAQRVTSATAAEVLRLVYGARTAGWPLALGYLSDGVGAPVDLSGSTLGELLDGLAAERGEAWSLTHRPRSCEGVIGWHTAPDLGDVSQDVVLVQGRNCEPDVAMNVARTPDELVGVARSFLAGTGAVAAKVAAPAGAVLGRRAALEAEVLSTLAVGLGDGTGDPLLSPSTPTRASLVAELTAKLHAALAPVVVASAEITDSSLWPNLRPGWVVACRFPDEPTGLFARALARVRTCTWSVLPPRGMTVSLELWAVL